MPEVTTGKLQVFSVISEAENKGLALFRLLCHIGAEQTLIFCNQRDTTEDVRDYLTQMGIPSARFHGGMDQPEREKTLVQFRMMPYFFGDFGFGRSRLGHPGSAPRGAFGHTHKRK